MASQIKVNEIIKQSGSSISIGESGDTISLTGNTINLGTTGNTVNIAGSAYAAVDNTPSFFAELDSNQSISSGSTTVIEFGTQTLDTDNCYSNSTYRFTPTTSGFYYIFTQTGFDTDTDFQSVELQIYKNGSTVISGGLVRNENRDNISISTIVQLNGSSDYVDTRVTQTSGGALNLRSTSGQTTFGGYKLIGA